MEAFLLLLMCACTSYSKASVITLEQSPGEIKPSITKTLTIRCALVDSPAASTGLVGRDVTSTPMNVKHLTSLVIYKDGVEFASVTTFSGSNGFVDQATMQVAGNISTSAGGEEGYLSITFHDPEPGNTGNFTCEGVGFTSDGHSVNYATSMSVAMATTQLSDVVAFIHQLDLRDREYKTQLTQLENLNSNLTQQVQQLNDKNSLLQTQLDSQVVTHKTEVSKLETTISGLKSLFLSVLDRVIFHDDFQALSEPYNSHRYILSKQSVANDIDSAQGICNSVGGYLAEIDSMAELNFTSTFTRKYTTTNFVWIGTKFNPSDKKWYQMTSGGEIGIPDFESSACGGHSGCDGGGEPCLGIEGLNMLEDLGCTRSGMSFLCEMEY